jgi:hypothetical protein
MLSGEHGLVIDNLIKVKIVTANGSILTASETENPDLFWGIRGGGCNFGVVTQFVLKLHPQRRTVFSGNIVYSADMVGQLIDAIDTWRSNMEQNQALMFILTTDPDAPTIPLLMVDIFYNGSEEEGRAIFKPFFDLKHIADLTKEIPYEELNASLNASVVHGQGRLMKDLPTIKPDLPLAKKVLDHLVSLAQAASEVQTTIFVEYFSYKKIQSIPNGTCAFKRPKFNYGVAFLTWKNNTPENLQLARSIGREFASIVTISQQKYLGGEVVHGYGNYAHNPDEDNKAEILFGENYPRLQELKKKYDPENIFNKGFAITPGQ